MTPSSSRFGITLVIFLLLLSFGLVYWDNQSGDEAENTLLKQFEAIKEQKFTEAYYAYTAKAFQTGVNLDEFKAFLRSYEQIGNDATFVIKEKDPGDTQRSILALISRPHSEPIYFNIDMVKEDSEWKVLGWHQSSPEERAQLYTLDHALDLIKSNKIEKAYLTFTALEFRNITTLEAFEEFVANYPILKTFTSSELMEIDRKDKHTVFLVKLQNGLQEAKLAFILEQEPEGWKIRGIQVKDEDIKPGIAEPFRDDELKEVVNGQLKAFKMGEVENAYLNFTSLQFQNETPLNDFISFIKDHPIFAKYKKASLDNLTFNNNIGILKVTLESATGVKQAADFSLVHEGDLWKVQQIQLYEEKTK